MKADRNAAVVVVAVEHRSVREELEGRVIQWPRSGTEEMVFNPVQAEAVGRGVTAKMTAVPVAAVETEPLE